MDKVVQEMDGETIELIVEGMSCQHCVSSVNKAVGALEGVNTVNVDRMSKKVIVYFNPKIVSLEDVKGAIEDQGYEVG